MKKKIIAACAAAAVLLTSACSGGEPEKTTAKVLDSEPEQTTAAAQAPVSEDDGGEGGEDDGGEGEEEESGGGSEEKSVSGSVSGFSMSVNGSTGTLSVSRSAPKSTPMGEPDTWTIFIYLCGTDLESGQGSATGDIAQMLEAEGCENVKFVFQTGGTSAWQNEVFSSEVAERYVIQNGDIHLADSVELKNMGDAGTLADFLNWGIENHPADKMGVVFWDHGGGSITGACFDELNEGNSLSLSEINTALSQVYANMTDKFEFIGFDCCLMGTAETANILATYARYFYGSQETEPGTGWDYTAIGSFLTEDPGRNGAQLGKQISDSFYEECRTQGQENEATFTIVDLEKFDNFAVAFNDYSKALYEAAGDSLADIVRSVEKADNFGGNNRSEGYTNMVDIGGIVDQCSGLVDGSSVLAALKDCIVYNINGSNHSGASGLSIYYPLKVEGSNELGIFSGVCISPYYLSLVDMIAKGYTDEGYSNDVFFTDDGGWSNENCETGGFDYSYFGYADEEDSGESSLITFEVEPMLTEDGIYGFVLDENGLNYAANVRAYMYMVLDDETIVEIGETFDINCDWESGVFTDGFDGYWLSLPDGKCLTLFVADMTDDYVVYTSPIFLNGERTNLRIRQGASGTVVEGAWDGIGENGMASRDIKKLKAGDKIVPIYYLDEEELPAGEYEWQDGDNVTYAYLPAAEYWYGFDITDIYGDYYISDLVSFIIDEDGSITFAP